MRTNLGICYEAIQRVYRNALVCQIRTKLTAAYPENWEQRVRESVGEEWKTAKSKMRERRLSGEVETEIKDDFDLLGVNHFYNLFDREFEVLFPHNPNVEESERRRQKQAILQWARIVKTLRDPLSHPTEQDFGYEDAFVMIDAARRVLVSLNLAEARDLKEFARQLSGARSKSRFWLVAASVAVVMFALAAFIYYSLSHRHQSIAAGTETPESLAISTARGRPARQVGLEADPLSTNPPANLSDLLPTDTKTKALYLDGQRKIQSEDYGGARKDFEQALAMSPQNVLLHLNLAHVLLMLGYNIRARQELEKTRQLSAELSAEKRLWLKAAFYEARSVAAGSH